MIEPRGADHIGSKYKNNQGLNFEVVGYKNNRLVTIMFELTGSVVVTTLYNVRKGSVLDKNHRSVYGVGYFGFGSFKSRDKAYSAWHSMMTRCYSGNERYKSWAECYVCEEWHNYQKFAEWYYDNIPSLDDVYDLDKDLKVKGNKIYGKDFCTFLTKRDHRLKSIEMSKSS